MSEQQEKLKSLMSDIADKMKQVEDLRFEMEHMFLESFGRNVKRLREGQDLSQKTFAEMIGISKATLINIEDAKQDTPLTMVYFMSQTLNCPVEDLTREYQEPEQVEPKLDSDRDSDGLEKVVFVEGVAKRRGRGPSKKKLAGIITEDVINNM